MKTKKTDKDYSKKTKAELVELLKGANVAREAATEQLRELRERASKLHLALHEANARHAEKRAQMLFGFACGIGIDLDPDYGCQVSHAAVVLPDYDCTRPGSTIVVVDENGNVYEATVTGAK
jgi:hypothetical protein